MLGYSIDGLEEVDQQPGLQEVQICEWLSVCTENLYLTWTSDRKRTAVSTRTVQSLRRVWDRINRAKGAHTDSYLGCQQAGVAVVVATLHISQVATDVSNGCENISQVATDVANDCD
jgi:hypothetical protein